MAKNARQVWCNHAGLNFGQSAVCRDMANGHGHRKVKEIKRWPKKVKGQTRLVGISRTQILSNQQGYHLS